MLMRKISELAYITGGELFNCDGEQYVDKFVINDSLSENNCAYIALNGENHKGIDFAQSAFKNGASLIISEVMPSEQLPTLLVNNAREALLDIAEYYRKKERKTVVAVTGSVGKTTVKELCYAVMSQKEPTLKTDGNKNNTVGLPLTLMSGSPEEIAVIEAGISEEGEMSKLSRVCSPNIAIITAIGMMHAETLGTRDAIAAEKLKILEYASQDCTLIIPENEPLLVDKHAKAITVAIDSTTADFSAENISYTASGTCFDVKRKGRMYISGAFVPIIGRHGALDALFAVAVGTLIGLADEQIKAGLAEYKCAENRQNIIVKNGITVMSDCYNFGPESARAALSAFKILTDKTKPDKTVLMLGSMLELGTESESLHIALGKEIADMGFDVLITLGNLAKNIALGALMHKMKNVYDYADTEREAAARMLCSLASEGSAVLIKGSRKLRMEEFTDMIIKA